MRASHLYDSEMWTGSSGEDEQKLTFWEMLIPAALKPHAGHEKDQVIMFLKAQGKMASY